MNADRSSFSQLVLFASCTRLGPNIVRTRSLSLLGWESSTAISDIALCSHWPEPCWGTFPMFWGVITLCEDFLILSLHVRCSMSSVFALKVSTL